MRSIIHLFLCLLLTSVGWVGAIQASESKRIGLLLDEAPNVPMRVEADVMAELTRVIVEKNSWSCDALVPTSSGIVLRDGTEVRDLNAYDALLIYQGDAISQETALFSDAVVEELKRYLNARPENAVALVGGAGALFHTLGFGNSESYSLLAFGEDRERARLTPTGEDRAQAGLIPTNPMARVFEGVELDRGTAWITNAAFPAFDAYANAGPTVVTLACAPAEGHANPFCAGVMNDCGELGIKAFLFAWRVSPFFDSAPETYKANFRRLIENMLTQAGQTLAWADYHKPLYTEPDFTAVSLALDYYAENFDEEDLPRQEEFRARLQALQARSSALTKSIIDKLGANIKGDEAHYRDVQTALENECAALQTDYAILQKEVLLASPELDFESFLFVKRDPRQMGLPENYNSNSVLHALGYRDELCRANLRDGNVVPIYKPAAGEFVGDLELYYDASKVMFSSPDVNANARWRLWELALDKDANPVGAPQLLDMINEPDVDNYDACYLPDDRVVFCSTASMTGVPCINGAGHVCNLYLKELDGSVRQLTIEQDHDWNPAVMNNGRVMYLRWEYVDLPHCFSRIMFHMNPDGTNQSELYGSGSYWPNSIFYARPLPGDGTKFVGVVTGHHEQNRVGDLVLFDPSKGRKETEGAIQRIPGRGKKVEPIACDLPIAQNWPKFLHPFPISETLFLVSCKRSASSPWEICLVDVFDNIVSIVTDPSNAALEPIPLRETERQPIVADRVDLNSQTADVFIADVYEGEGLKGVERGTIKALRIFSYQFAYQGMGAEPYSIGLDGPWDPRRIIGTVPVNEDGSASFKIPAYVPISLQPLDAEGKAVQIMRSWITALPGESVSCIGCHEPQNSTGATNPRGVASQMAPVEIEPFYGPARGFGFEREIQPILDRYCVECHQPESAKLAEIVEQEGLDLSALTSTKRPNETFELQRVPDFRKSDPKCVLERGSFIAEKSPISNAYYQLRRFVRTNTKESQMPTHRPYDFHADASLLVQILSDHHGVELDPASWEKLYAWIDLNAPYNANWGETVRDAGALVKSQFARREELRALYAPSSKQLDDDPNDAFAPTEVEETPLRVRLSSTILPDPEPAPIDLTREPTTSRVDLSNGIALELVDLPGTNLSVGRFEITNEQYKLFDPSFDSGIEYGDFLHFSPGERGWLLSRAKQPVARVSYQDAQAFCAWLSEQTGDEYRLPTLAEWRQFACVADGASFAFAEKGTTSADYSRYENLADSTHGAISTFGWMGRCETLPGWRPVDWNVNDHCRVSAPVGSYLPNALGIFDAQGNVAEWTSSERVDVRETIDLENDGAVVERSETVKKIVAGGSWLTPMRYAGAEKERAFKTDFNLRDVGLRVVRVRK